MDRSEAQDVARQIYEGLCEVAIDITIGRGTPTGRHSSTEGGRTSYGTAIPAKAVSGPASKGTIEAFDIRFEGGSLIETHLRALKVPAYGLEIVPGPGDVVEGLEDSAWKVLGVTPETLVGVPLVYNLTVKR